MLEEIYAISGMMSRLEVIHGEVKFAPWIGYSNVGCDTYIYILSFIYIDTPQTEVYVRHKLHSFFSAIYRLNASAENFDEIWSYIGKRLK